MGTSTQSTKDVQDARVLKRLLKAPQKKKKHSFKADLNRVLGRTTKKALDRAELKPVRAQVLAVIAKQIKEDILPKFTKWENEGSVISKWPFKTKKKNKKKNP